jgi:hypothetical protein
MGFASSTIAHRTRPTGGQWQRPLPGVVLLHNGTPTDRERIRAALLYAGDGSCVTGGTALRLFGLRTVPAGLEVAMLIPQQRHRVSTRFVVCERTDRFPQPVERDGLPLAPLPRALLDHTRKLLSLTDVRALVAEAIQRHLCAQSDLLGELNRAQRRGTARVRVVAREIIAGIRSVAEAEMRDLIQAAGIRQPEWNMDLLTTDGQFIACPDAYWPDLGIALEVDSRQWHLSPDGWERTMRRRMELSRYGVTVIHVSPQRIRQDRHGLVEDIRATLAAAKLRQPPQLLVVRRSQAA